MKSFRNSNIEVLRIIAMIMIIGHHYILYGVMQMYDSSIAMQNYVQGSAFNRYIAQIMFPGGFVGVGIFFLIAGYYGIEKKISQIGSAFKKVLLYSILGMLIYFGFTLFYGFNRVDIFQTIIASFCPVSNNAYWFVSSYLLIQIMKPTINEWIIKVKRKYVLPIIGVGLLIYGCDRYYQAYYLGLVNGLLFYFIGAEIKINENSLLENRPRIVCLVVAILSWLMSVVFANVTFWEVSARYSSVCNVLGVCIWGTLAAVAIVVSAISKSVYVNDTINKVSASVFAVYLIHEHPLLREYLWEGCLKVASVQWKSRYFVLFAFVSVIIVFCLSVGVNEILEKLLDKRVSKSIERLKSILIEGQK